MKNVATWTFYILALLSFGSCALLNNDSTNEGKDAYWIRLAKVNQASHEPLLSTLQKEAPKLYQQIMIDTQDPLLTSFWGTSFNFDSGAKKAILAEPLIEQLQEAFAIKNDNKIVHAGIMHTYGYLFSTLETPFGYKRKRWINPTLNRGFGLKGLSLSPQTLEGTMFSNVTFFAAMACFKLEGQKSQLLELKNVSQELRDFDYKSLKTTTIEETPNLENGALTIRTTLIELPQTLEGDDNTHLLIYSLFDQALQKEMLITAFPVKEDVFKSWLEPTTLGSDRLINFRYNGAHMLLSGKVLRGKRELYR